MTDEELLRGLVAARAWRGTLHPRGSDGRFIDVGGFVKWLAGGDRRVGEVTDVRPSRDGKPLVTVKEDNGRVSVLRPEQLSGALKPKAHLGGSSEVGAKSGISHTPKAHLPPVSPQVEEAASRLYSESEHHGFTGRPTESGLTKPDTGFAVGVPGHTLVIPPDVVSDRTKTKKLMQEWFDKQAKEVGDNPHLHFGGWTEDETGEVYLDLSEVYPSQSQAESVGSSRDEIEIWDIANGTGIPIGGTGGRDNVAVAADGGRRDGPDPEAAVRVPLRLVGEDTGAEGRLLGGSPERHPAGRDRRLAATAASGAAAAVTPDVDALRARVHGVTASATPDELRLRVHAPALALVAAAKGVAVWDSGLHPRGRDGRFIDVGSIVRFLVGGTPHTGKVDGINADKTGKGDSKINVTDGSGKSYTLDPGDVLRSVPVRGRINPPGEGGSVQVDHDNGHVTKNGLTVGRVTHLPSGKFLAEDIDANDIGEYETEGDAVDGVVKNTGLRSHDEIGSMAAITTGTGTKDDPIITDDVDVAVKALQEDKYVQLNQPDEVATLLDKLAEVANAYKAQGVNAKGKFDLCKVSVPKTNIFCAQAKVPDRLHMPQLGGVPSPGTQADALPKDENGEVDLSDQFIDHLAGLGIKVTDTQREASHLRASQGQLDGATVAGMMTNANYDPGKKPIFVTRDGYVVDGHHRWAAVTGRSYKAGEPLPMNVREIDANIIDVLALANDFATKMGMPQRTMGEGGPVKPPKSTLVDEVGTTSGTFFEPKPKFNVANGKVTATLDGDVIGTMSYEATPDRIIVDGVDVDSAYRGKTYQGPDIGQQLTAELKKAEGNKPLLLRNMVPDEVGGKAAIDVGGLKQMAYPELLNALDEADTDEARGAIQAELTRRKSADRPDNSDLLDALDKADTEEARQAIRDELRRRGGDEVGGQSGLLHPAADAVAMSLAQGRRSGRGLSRENIVGPLDLTENDPAAVAINQKINDLARDGQSVADIADALGVPESRVRMTLGVAASAHPWKRYLAMIASGAVKPDSPFLSADGTSWNGQPVPDKVRVAITAPMGKTTDNATASALNELYRTLVLSNGQEVALDSIIQMVDQLETVAAAEGTDPGDAKTLQNASKLVRTILAIPDQVDLDRAQEKANGKAKSLGGPSKDPAAEEEGSPGEEAGEAPAEEATEVAEGTDAPAPAPAADAAPAEAAPADAAASDDAAMVTLRKRVHG